MKNDEMEKKLLKTAAFCFLIDTSIEGVEESFMKNIGSMARDFFSKKAHQITYFSDDPQCVPSNKELALALSKMMYVLSKRDSDAMTVYGLKDEDKH